MDVAARLAALEARLTATEAALDPQRLRQDQEFTWDPRGLADVLQVQDDTGVFVARRLILQFDGDLTTVDDPAGKRTVITAASSASAGGVSHTVSSGFLDVGAAQAVPGLGCTVTVPDDGTGNGAVLFSYGVVFRSHNNATVGSATTSWDFRVNGSQTTPSATANPTLARPSITLVSISAPYFIHTAPSGVASASSGADTDKSGGLALTQGGGGSGFGPVPAAPIMLRLPSGSRTIDVYWTVSGSVSTNTLSIEGGMSACIPLGV